MTRGRALGYDKGEKGAAGRGATTPPGRCSMGWLFLDLAASSGYKRGMARWLRTARPVGAPELGLVCITASEEVRYRTVTRTRLLAAPAGSRSSLLHDLYAANAGRLETAIRFCSANRIRLYRITSDLFPFSDDPLGKDVLAGFRRRLRSIGDAAAAGGIRLVLHPDQFVVLSSDNPAVVRNSVGMLRGQARVLDLLGQPRAPWAAIEIHGGKGGRGAELARRIPRLPAAVRTRLVLENDERAYGAGEILEVCRAAGVPMVFDAHHHAVHDGLRSYDHPSVARFLEAARETWPDRTSQIVHISNGRESFSDSRHADLVTRMPACFRQAPWIEVEAKLKEEAIRRLRRQGWGVPTHPGRRRPRRSPAARARRPASSRGPRRPPRGSSPSSG
jgi:UV DNA damage endonuclease